MSLERKPGSSQPSKRAVTEIKNEYEATANSQFMTATGGIFAYSAGAAPFMILIWGMLLNVGINSGGIESDFSKAMLALLVTSVVLPAITGAIKGYQLHQLHNLKKEWKEADSENYDNYFWYP